MIRDFIYRAKEEIGYTIPSGLPSGLPFDPYSCLNTVYCVKCDTYDVLGLVRVIDNDTTVRLSLSEVFMRYNNVLINPYYFDVDEVNSLGLTVFLSQLLDTLTPGLNYRGSFVVALDKSALNLKLTNQ